MTERILCHLFHIGLIELEMKLNSCSEASGSMPWQINDRYEFPLQLDLDKDDGKYLSP